MPLSTPRLRIIRRLGTPLPGLTRKTPAVSGAAALRPGAHPHRKPSTHRLRLEEKQKLRYHYGVSERQMVRYMDAARRQPGAVGENLLVLLERRLDSVVFRLGMAPTIRAARQLVGHGHVEVNAHRLDRPGYLVRAGDVIALSPRARERALRGGDADHRVALRTPGFLARGTAGDPGGRVASMPARSDVPFPLREALVVAYYAR